MEYRTGILGTNFQVPPRVVTNAELEKVMETSDEWIQQRTGVKQRRYIDQGMTGATLAAEAARRALDEAGMKPSEVDAIICATLSPDRHFPGNAVFLQEQLGNWGSAVYDVRNQCTGFPYSLALADKLVRAGVHERVLVCGAELHSTGLEMATRSRDVSVMFGDGAGVFIVGRETREGHGILSTHLHGEGQNARLLWTDCEGSAHHPRLTSEMLEDGRIFPAMKGRVVFMHAIRRFPEVIEEALKANNVTKDDVDCFVFHQANLRIIEFVSNQMELPPEKTHNNIQVYGNTTAASIPIAFHEAREKGLIKRGSLVLIAAFGSGFTWASILLRF